MKMLKIFLCVGAMALCVPSFAQTQKEQRRTERERRIAQRATQTTELEVKQGKTPNYNRLLKSTDYKLIYREGLRYYSLRTKPSGGTSYVNLRKAQTLLEQAIRSQAFYGTAQADSLYYFYGSSFFAAGDYVTSQDAFDKFRREFATSEFVEPAEYKFAMGFYHLSPDPEHDQSVTVRAISAISEYVGRYPQTEHRDECEKRILELRGKLYTKSFENAKLYYKIGQYKAAERALSNAIDEYPASPYREELMYLATKSAYLYAKNSVTSQQTDRYLSMMDYYYNLISEFPSTAHLREVAAMKDEAQKYVKSKDDGNN